ncbi:Pyruvate phosphate dikinase, PEP/pyruvate binding domain [Butyrivibrio fibrisolvens DSM 3071]|uniref:Pyruvate phosphate dikinase, PEP/pyruvate binding domain n=1 Tax=Butyrivibrio fibrisolvens DSM 3071 TaxID=1121131 RepID=A0A1M5ZCN3_BUTFI|nr:PEP/pyruvate-binding domain-containing protein [Butyrivibrio fibrisolvens]SHI21970.1 Pyruvate phosphate dikinase, PEP/pyruvate binding domain [Butyrivibrio fibrisolvens DSM 3071]
MAAFDRIESGIPEMDKALDNIRLGDNVVFRVSDLSEFKLFVDPYIAQAKKDGRNIIYFRFASHEPLVEDCPEVKTINVPLTHRFETFTVDIHNIIEKEGKDAFYVFDCLSELQIRWATDLMMGNFFRVTCPFLFILDTVAFFPIIRGKHSFHAVNKILNTTQLFLDVYSDSKHVYVRPEKVWNRDSETMFLPHIYNKEDNTFRPILDGVQSSRFYQLLDNFQRPGEDQYIDFWDKFFNMARMQYDNDMDIEESCNIMCNIMMTRDEKMRAMVRKHFKPDDYFNVRSHMIGTGLIGGKACGMLLARAIIRNMSPEIDEVLEPHDSFFIGSDIYYTYIVDNEFWDLRIRQRTEEEYFSLADEFALKLKQGVFAEDLKTKFKNILDYYGQDPFIVRSSSILEDGFGNAFAGKYESVFCANRGTLEERLDEFENAVRTVYASTMSLSALDYRKRRGLDKRDEQMSLLVQRVSGSYYGSYYMPCAAGVGYSYSPYQFLQGIDPKAGMLRLVMGLGTSAVDRTMGSYPRLVSLDMPQATSCVTVAEKHQFSQRAVEAVDVSEHTLKRLELKEIEEKIPVYLKNTLLEHDYEVESSLRSRGIYRDVRFISCLGLVKKDILMSQMQQLMHLIQEEYQHPVDIEFTMNLSENGEYSINLLQCRPLQVFKDTAGVSIPDKVSEDKIILESKGSSMGLSRCTPIDLLVYVEPKAYYNMPYADKARMAKVIGKINWGFRGEDRHMMLIVPGRIGTSSPELGVPTTFADISEFEAVCEVEEKEAGYNPELSYGSHIFQDLVEADILYTAVFANEKTLHFSLDILKEHKNIASEYIANDADADIVKVYDLKDSECNLYYDLEQNHLLLSFE